jgi:hypothetical protein
MPLDPKYLCPECGYEDSEPGICPACEIDLEKVCDCGSGEFAKDCCGTEPEGEKIEEEE